MFPFSTFVNNCANDTIKSDTFEIVRYVRRYRSVFSTLNGIHQSSVFLSATKLLTAVVCAIWVLVTQIVDVIILGVIVAVAVAVIHSVDATTLGVVVTVTVAV